MSGPELTPEVQLRYILSWFQEFSELQREDFLPILAAARAGKQDQLAATLAAMSCQDKPLSLFQCRVKLFNQWYPTWTEDIQDRLVKGVSETDDDFGKKLKDVLTNGLQVNGDFNGEIDGQVETEEEQPQDEVPGIDGEGQGVAQDNIQVEIAASS